MRRAGRRPRGVRARAAAATASPTPCVLGMGGSSLAPEVFRAQLRRADGPAAARARLDRRRRDRARSRRAIDLDEDALRRLDEVRRHDRDARSLADHFWEQQPRRRGTSSRSPTRARRSRSSRRRAGFRRVVPRRPRDRRALQRAQPLRHRPRRAHGRAARRRCSTAPRPPRRRAAAATRARTTAALWLGAALGALREGRARQADVRRRRREIASLGLWLEQLVAESTGKHGRGHPARRRRAARRAGRTTATTASSCTCAGRRRRGSTSVGPRATPATRCFTIPTAGPRTSAGSSSSPSSPPRWPAGRSRSTRSTSPTCRRPRTTRPRRSRRGRRRALRRAAGAGSTTLLDGAAPPDYVAIMAYAPPSDELDAAMAELRAAIRDEDEGHDDVRLRPALPALDRPVPQGRPADRALPPARRRRRARRRRSRRRRFTFEQLKRAQAVGDSRDAARATACRRSGSAAGPTPRPRCASSRGRCADADRLRRAREDGRQHGPSHPPRLGPPGRSPSTSARRRASAAEGHGAQPARRRSRSSCSKLDAPRIGVDHGPGRRPDRSRPSTALAELLDEGDTIIDGGNSKWTDDKRARGGSSRRSGIHYVDVGTSGGVWGLEVGYCMMVGGDDEAVERLAPDPRRARPAGRRGARAGLAALRPDRRGPLREDGPQRDRVRPDAGLRRGLRPVRQVRVRPRQGEDRPPVDAGLGRALVAVRARRARVRAGGQRPRRARPRTPPTPARAAGRSRTRWTRTSRRPSSPPALYARFYSRGNGDFTGRMLSALRAQFGGHAVKTQADGVTRDRARTRSPQGLERLPVHPTTLVIFGATGDLARRKLLPALYNLAHEGALPERFHLVGASRGELSDEDFREQAVESIREFSRRAARRGRARAAARRRPLRRRAPFDDPRRLRAPRRDALDELDEGAGHAAQPLLLPLDGAVVLPGDRRARSASTGLHRHEERRRPRRRSRSRSGTTSSRRASSTGACSRWSRSTRSSASTTTWARRPSRTCWRSASRTGCSSRSGTATTSTTSRSPRPRTSAIGTRAGYYDTSGALRDLVQNHMLQLLTLLCMEPPVRVRAPTRCATRRSRCCARSSRPTPSRIEEFAVRGAVRGRARSRARTSRATSTSPTCRTTRRPRRTPRCASRSTTGAGPACRSTCAPASASRAR